MRILHIASEELEGQPDGLLFKKFGELRPTAAEQVVMCPQGSESEIFCFNNEITCFPLNTNRLAILDNTSLIKRICKNYKIDTVYVYDGRARKILRIASKLHGGLKKLNVKEDTLRDVIP